MTKQMIYVVQETHDDAPELIDWYFDVHGRIEAQAQLVSEAKNYETWQFEYEGPMDNIQAAIKSELAARAMRNGDNFKGHDNVEDLMAKRMEPAPDQPVVVTVEPYHLKCTECDGTDLTFDATVHWSTSKQDWVVNEKLDGVSPYCGDCAGDTDAVLKFDDTIKTVKPFDIPQKVGLFATPDNMKHMQDYLADFHAGDVGIANSCAWMMFNLCVDMMHKQRDHYETIFEEITGESRPWEADDD